MSALVRASCASTRGLSVMIERRRQAGQERLAAGEAHEHDVLALERQVERLAGDLARLPV